MKKPITWHEYCLKNNKAYLEKERIAFAKHAELIKVAEQQLQFYERQITLAKKRKLTEFDRDRLGVSRKRKN